MSPRSVWAAFAFELKRLRATSRVLWWIGLSLFPPALVALVYRGELRGSDRDVASMVIFILTAGVVNLLGLLLAATTAVHSELEGKTWTYLAVRPRAKGSVLIGKYLSATLWSASAATVGMSLSLLVTRPPAALSLALHLGGLNLFASLAYGSLYLLFGVLFLKRAMVVAVSYTIFVEVLVALLPAVVKEFTLNYHLSSLLPQRVLVAFWWKFEQVPPPPEPLKHLAFTGAYTMLFLTLAVFVLRRRQLVTAEGDA
jgi:ABC-type transport system involved in multi-copper enzyme maturation permease subunit